MAAAPARTLAPASDRAGGGIRAVGPLSVSVGQVKRFRPQEEHRGHVFCCQPCSLSCPLPWLPAGAVTPAPSCHLQRPAATPNSASSAQGSPGRAQMGSSSRANLLGKPVAVSGPVHEELTLSLPLLLFFFPHPPSHLPEELISKSSRGREMQISVLDSCRLDAFPRCQGPK